MEPKGSFADVRLGRKRTFAVQNVMSALPPKADILGPNAMSAKCQKRTSAIDDVAVNAPTTVCASVRLTSRPNGKVRTGATRKVFQIRVDLQHLLHVYLGTVLKSLNAVDYVLPSRQQFDLFRLRLRLAGSDGMLEQKPARLLTIYFPGRRQPSLQRCRVDAVATMLTNDSLVK